jgi:hypothetical protein
MYNPSQLRLIARELAHSGGYVQAALDALHRDYESFRTLNERTVRRLLKHEDFRQLMMQEEKIVGEARVVTDIEIAKAREEAQALQKNPLRQMVMTAAGEAHDLARRNPDAKNYRVLFSFAKLSRSMEPR